MNRRPFRNKRYDQSAQQEADKGLEKLFVFGYSCRLYAPPQPSSIKNSNFEFSSTISSSEMQLIAWNGDENLKIDRYDCRLYLQNLDEFDNDITTKRLNELNQLESDSNLSIEERLEEELCDEERYIDMYNEIRKTEERERLKRGQGSEIGFNYEQKSPIFDLSGLTTTESSSSEEEIDEPYVIQEGLKLPVGMNLPETKKQSVIIERTASFVVNKGPQMEIVIKAKQRNNAALFGFLEFDNRLNPFYKYICKLIREQKYTPTLHQTKIRAKSTIGNRRLKIERQSKEVNALNTSQALKMIATQHNSEDEEDELSDGDDNSDGYLHPLLRAKFTVDSVSGNVKECLASANTRTDGEEFGMRPEPRTTPSVELVFDEILAQLQRQVDTTENVYSSLYKNLNSIISTNRKANSEKTERLESNNEKKTDFTPEIVYEEDMEKIKEYNDWHIVFYGRPSPYLPNGPPVTLPPPPNFSSSLDIAARYVATNGSEAEQKLIDHNGDGCSFLFAESPYYTYYQSRVRQIQWTLNQANSGVFSLSASDSQESETSMLLQSSNSTASFLDFPDPPKPPSALVMVRQAHTTDTPIPTEITRNHQTESENTNFDPESSNVTSEAILKRERKERARLFMEKILNEKLAAKKRQREENRSLLPENRIAGPSSSSTTAQNPIIHTKTISALIDAKIQHVIKISPLLAPPRIAALINYYRTQNVKSNEMITNETIKNDDIVIELRAEAEVQVRNVTIVIVNGQLLKIRNLGLKNARIFFNCDHLNYVKYFLGLRTLTIAFFNVELNK